MKVNVLGVPMNPGTRRYRLTTGRRDDACIGDPSHQRHTHDDDRQWTGRVLWIDPATAAEPLQVVMEDRDHGTRVLTQHADGHWTLSGTYQVPESEVLLVEPIKQHHRPHVTTLQELLVIRR